MASMSSSPNLPKSGAVSKGYNFAATWELNAPLTELQQVAITALAHSVSERPYPSHLNQVPSDGLDNSSLSTCLKKDSVEVSRPVQQVLVNTNQFYKWFSDLESAMKSETEEKYQNYMNTLTEHIKTCDHVLYQVDTTLNLFNELQFQHHAIARKTKTIRDDCDRLLEENRKSTEFSEALRSKLNYFDELEKLASVFNSPNMGVRSENFFSSLKRLDESMMYVEDNPQYAESSVYLVKFRQLQSRALAMVRAHVLSVLRSASSQILDIFRSRKGSVSEGLEASVIYVRFEAAAGELKPVLEEIEKRSSRKEYLHILTECQRMYREQRLSVVRGIVHQRISEFAKKEALQSLTRSGCAYLVQVCQLEYQLFSHFFPSSCEENSILAQLMDPLCTYFYDTLRPRFIHETNINSLCELVGILKIEVLGEQISRRFETFTGLRPILERILADVRERLTFVARTHIRNEIANYIPLDQDINYPAKLELSSDAIQETTKDTGASDAFEKYPPLEKTLSCLSMLYRHLEHVVFTGLAQEVIEVCAESIQKASKLIAKRSSLMDGQLFLIKHLLILREQIAPFDLDFSVTHKELDFSNLLEHLRRILKGQASIFDWSKSTSLARTLSPRVLENQIDARKELEKSLKASCEEFIMAVTKLVVDPMLSFVTKVTAVKVAFPSANEKKSSDVQLSRPLKDQAFATPDKVADLVQKVNHSIDHELPVIIRKMKLYLQNPSTQVILFRPIKTNIVEAHIQVESLLRNEYSAQDIQLVGMMDAHDLHARLDGLISES